MTPADVLRRAAAAFRGGELTWGQGQFVQPLNNACRCAIGAVAYAVNPGDVDGDPFFSGVDHMLGTASVVALTEYLIEQGAPVATHGNGEVDVIETVGGWNDDKRRTPDEVIDALEAAAAWDEARVAA